METEIDNKASSPKHPTAPSSHRTGRTSEDTSWKLPITTFTSKLCSKEDYKHLPKKVRRYYEAQNELIEAYVNLQSDLQVANIESSPVCDFFA